MESGDKNAKTQLAWYKLSGLGGAKVDIDGAFAILEERVKDKDAEAMWMLGVCYEYGIGCEQDLARTETLYTQSKDCDSDIGGFLAMHRKDERGTGKMTARFLSL